MGRKPIGKAAMTSSERQRRFLDKLRGTKGKTDNAAVARPGEAEIRKLKAAHDKLAADLTREITAHGKTQTEKAQLERDLARETAARKSAEEFVDMTNAAWMKIAARSGQTPSQQRRPESRRADAKGDTVLMKLIRRLDSPDSEAVAALRKLASELQSRGRGFQELADLTARWDQEDAVVRPPKPKPIDWPEVERAVKMYTEGKTKVTINKVTAAVYDHVPALKRSERSEEVRSDYVYGFLVGCLERLGFRRRGEMTYERRAPTN
jgi:hypothetical protein